MSRTEHAASTAESSVSPLVGTRTLDGAVLKPDVKALEVHPIDVHAGSLAVTYVAAGGALAGIVGKAPIVQRERDTYTTPETQAR